MSTEIATIVSSIGAVLSAIVAGVGLFIAWRIHSNQQTLTKQISDGQQSLTTTLHDSQKLLAQRQLLIPLWGYISGLNAIDSSNPVTQDIIKAINTMELVALCCEGQMIDERIINRTFSRDFMELYRSIESTTTIPGLNNKTGKDLLHDARAASAFYEKLRTSHLNSDSIS
jgi:hypothetical protein